MITINADKTITCPAGDTGLFLVQLFDQDDQPLLLPSDGVAIFAVAERTSEKSGFVNRTARRVDTVDNTVTVWLPSSLTRKLTPGGSYYWDIRLVSDPDTDEEGNIVALDDSDEVTSVYAGRPEGMPKFVVPGVAINV